MTRRLLADDDDWDDEDEDDETEALPGSVETLETNPVNDLLLELISAVPRLAVLLAEADPGEFKAAKPRLDTFLALVAQVPTKATAKEPMGFKAPAKKKSTKAKRKAVKK